MDVEEDEVGAEMEWMSVKGARVRVRVCLHSRHIVLHPGIIRS